MEILKTSGFNNIYEFSCFQKEFESLFNKNIKNYNKNVDLCRFMRIINIEI